MEESKSRNDAVDCLPTADTWVSKDRQVHRVLRLRASALMHTAMNALRRKSFIVFLCARAVFDKG